MLGSWEQPKVRGPFQRFSGSFRGFIGRFGSLVHLIVVLNVVVFAVQILCAAVRFPYFEQYLSLSGDAVRRGFVWQFLTYMFLHSTIFVDHIIFNLISLWFLGRDVEYHIGPKYFTRLYFFGGLLGGVLWVALNFQFGRVIGASAGVLAVVVAYATLWPDRLLMFEVKAKYWALILIALDAVPVLREAGSNIAHAAHLGGAAFGYLYIKQLGYGATPRWLSWLHGITARLKPHRRPTPRNMSSEEFVREEIDPILDKIAREGMQSLTRRERKILESAKDLMQKRPR